MRQKSRPWAWWLASILFAAASYWLLGFAPGSEDGDYPGEGLDASMRLAGVLIGSVMLAGLSLLAIVARPKRHKS
jgi:hypothetical protein